MFRMLPVSLQCYKPQDITTHGWKGCMAIQPGMRPQKTSDSTLLRCDSETWLSPSVREQMISVMCREVQMFENLEMMADTCHKVLEDKRQTYLIQGILKTH